MWVLLLVTILIPQLPFESVVEWTYFLHEWCLNRVSTYSQNSQIQEALVCGKSLPLDSVSRKLFTQSGMIHLMVVSGAHLMFLEKILSLFPIGKYKKIFTMCLLTFYSFCTQMNPPVLRALLSIFLNEFSKKFQLHWSSWDRLIGSGIVCIFLQPSWIHSVSLQLSLVATLAFCYNCKFRLIPQTLGFVFIVPLVSSWTLLHPLSILLNWILFPIFASLIFPLSILSFVLPFFYPTTQFLMNQFIFCLNYLQPFLETVPLLIPPVPPSFRWIYVFILFILFKFMTLINLKNSHIL